MNVPCLEVVITDKEHGRQTFAWFGSVNQVADYIRSQPLCWKKRVEIHNIIQDDSKVTKLGEPIYREVSER